MVNKHRVETFIVPRLGVATPVAGTTLYNATTGTPNLAVGGFGVYEVIDTTGNHVAVNNAAVTVANTPFWKIVMRRDTSLDTLPLPLRTYSESAVVDASCKVTARGTSAAIPNNNLVLVGAAVGSAGEIPVNNETEYIVNCSMRGWNTDLYNGMNRPLKMGRFTTPDYSVSTFYTVVDQQVDHIIGNVAYDFNNQSWTQAIALCINSTADAGLAALDNVIDITTVAASAIGDVIIIGHMDDGQAITLTMDRDLIQTFNELIANVPASANWLLVPYARLTTANVAVATRAISGGRVAADATAVVDQLLFLALDRAPAAYQEAPQEKERLLVGLDGGFDTTTNLETVVDPNEGAGLGTDLLNWYRDIQSHRMYVGGGKAWQPNHVEFGNEIERTGFYDVYVIEHCKARLASSGMPSVSPQVTIVALLNRTAGDAVTNPFYTGVANPQKTYLQTFLNTWMPTTQYPYTALAL